jgi:phage terminase large subunit-like protein
MLLTSTAGHADSVVLRAFYDRLRRQASGDEAPDPTFYGAWWESEDEDAGLDWAQIKQANPALGDGRLTRQAISSEFAILPPDSWRRERLNHFVDVRADGAFNPGVWAACRVEDPLGGLSGPFALGVDVQPGWERATICVSGVRTDGRIGVEVYRDLRGTDGDPVTAARVIDAVQKFPDPLAVIAYDQVSGAAASFLREANETGAPWDPLKPAAIVAACMDVDEMIRAGRLAVDDPLLDAQIPLAARRPVGADGAFRFSRAASLGPIDAVMAMVLAAHAIAYTGPEPKIT